MLIQIVGVYHLHLRSDVDGLVESAVVCFFLFGHLLLPCQQLLLFVECRGSQELLLLLLQILVSAWATPLGEDGSETGHAWAVQDAGIALWPSNRVL